MQATTPLGKIGRTLIKLALSACNLASFRPAIRDPVNVDARTG
jgi:hypothetical protein